MVKRKVVVGISASTSVAEAAFFIESKGLVTTAEKFSDDVHDFLANLGDERKSYPFCRDEKRMVLGLKCVTFRKKYTVVFIETQKTIHVREFIPSKMIWW